MSGFWTPARFAEITRGTWIAAPADERAAIAGVSIDTRTLEPSQAYVAIKGERFDGHGFVNAALSAGASLAIVETDVAASGPLLRVASTVAALQDLASAYRDELRAHGCRVIGITGSNGKTTTRHIIHGALSRKRLGTQSPKSFNNHLGVPLTLLASQPGHDFVVVEIGSNHPGEVDALAGIVRPDAAVVTSVGHEHLEFFGTLDAVADEEFSVLRRIEPGGLAVVPELEAERYPAALAKALTRELRLVLNRFGSDPAVPADFPLLGEHNRRNAAAAAAVARWMGMRDEEITQALRTVTPVEGRLQTIAAGGITIIHDAYNANPSSMREALLTLGLLPTSGRRIAVLGDMLELGDQAPTLHRQTADVLFELDAGGRHIDHVYTVGPLSMFTADALARRWGGSRVTASPAWSDDLPKQVAAAAKPGDVVLLKGSRGMRLERLIPALTGAAS